MIKAFENLEVWFVTGAQLLYGGETVKIVDGHSKDMVEISCLSMNEPTEDRLISSYIEQTFPGEDAAASKLASATHEDLISIAPYMRADDSSHTLDEPFILKENERLGFVFPVHGWRVPKLVREFIGKMKVQRAEPDAERNSVSAESKASVGSRWCGRSRNRPHGAGSSRR